jgi:1-acyl-sn-glycerol-3-phosphate acyltransferase
MLVRMWKKKNTPPLLVELQTGTTTLKISLAVPQKIGPIIPLLSIYTEDVPTCNKDTCFTMFILVLFIIARSWKQP